MDNSAWKRQLAKAVCNATFESGETAPRFSGASTEQAYPIAISEARLRPTFIREHPRLPPVNQSIQDRYLGTSYARMEMRVCGRNA